MSDPRLIGQRPLPPFHRRITSDGADQYVLACNARREADDHTFNQLVAAERVNTDLRAELTWLREHASTRTARWIAGKLLVRVYVVSAFLIALACLRYTAEGHAVRVSLVQGMWSGEEKVGTPWDQPHWVTSDLSRHEIDSLAMAYITEHARSDHVYVP